MSTTKTKNFHVSQLLRKATQTIQFDPTPNVTKQDIPKVDGAFILNNVLTKKECEQFIKISEELKYEQSPLNYLYPDGSTSRISEESLRIRNNLRVLTDAPEDWYRTVCGRVVKFLPKTLTIFGEIWDLNEEHCLNERWRFNKYEVGHYFKPHFDVGFTKNVNEKTLLTFILYLNDGFEGGETIFFPGGKSASHLKQPDREEVKVKPKQGMALVFYQDGELNYRHEGAPHVSKGKYKYIIRSDIFYVRRNKIQPKQKNPKGFFSNWYAWIAAGIVSAVTVGWLSRLWYKRMKN